MSGHFKASCPLDAQLLGKTLKTPSVSDQEPTAPALGPDTDNVCDIDEEENTSVHHHLPGSSVFMLVLAGISAPNPLLDMCVDTGAPRLQECWLLTCGFSREPAVTSPGGYSTWEQILFTWTVIYRKTWV